MSLNAAALEIMVARGLSAADILEIARALEVKRDPTAAERKRRQREREQEQIEECHGDESQRDMSRRDVTRDTPIPSPSFPPNPLTNPTPAPVNNNSRARGTRLAADFELPDDWRDWAVKDRGWSQADAEEEGLAFTDFWHGKPGRDGTKADWPATWRNWCRNSRRGAGRVNGSARQPAVPL